MLLRGISAPTVPPLWREGRTGLELAALLRDPVFRHVGVSGGQGRPVMLIPGFLAGDGSLGVMTMWLRRAGYRTRSAGTRLNVDCSGESLARIEPRLADLVEAAGARATIIGQSRGGGLARTLAVRRPDLVNGVVALGSPLTDPLAVHPLVLLQVRAVGALGSLGVPGLFSRDCVEGGCCRDFREAMETPMPDGVGFVSIYSRTDGIVDWQTCLDPQAEQVEVGASHIGMAVNPAVYRTIGNALTRFGDADADAVAGDGLPAAA